MNEREARLIGLVDQCVTHEKNAKLLTASRVARESQECVQVHVCRTPRAAFPVARMYVCSQRREKRVL